MSQTSTITRRRRRISARKLIAPLAVTAALAGAGLGVTGTASASSDASYATPTLAVANDPAEGSAVAWAEDQLRSTQWDGECLQFVDDAYSQAGVDIGSQSSSTYSAVNYWNGYSETKNPPSTNPPVGALIFYGATSANPDGHVAMSVGNGRAISSEERDNSGVHTFDIATRDASYSDLGWIMPG
jgi:cell wall-associated NlpC family hydrolase